MRLGFADRRADCILDSGVAASTGAAGNRKNAQRTFPANDLRVFPWLAGRDVRAVARG